MQTEELQLGIYDLSRKEPDDTAEKKPHECLAHHSRTQNSFQKCYITPEEIRVPRTIFD